jgi:hypothetical protein
MTAETRYRPSLLLLWFGILVPPVAWSLHLSFEYFFTTLNCQLQVGWAETLLHVTTPVVMALTIAAGVAAYIGLKQTQGSDSPEAMRARFMAASGLILSGLFLLLIVFGAIPVYFLDRCSEAH